MTIGGWMLLNYHWQFIGVDISILLNIVYLYLVFINLIIIFIKKINVNRKIYQI